MAANLPPQTAVVSRNPLESLFPIHAAASCGGHAYACIVDLKSDLNDKNMHTICNTSLLSTCYYCWHIFELNII